MNGKIKIVFQWIRKICMNKYLLTCLIAVIYLTFFDSNTIIDYYTLCREEKKIKREISHYEKLSRDSREQMSQLKTDKDSLEKFAREQFLMKRTNEDIFLLNEE